MMRSPGKVATAVRLPDGTIQVKTDEFVSISRRAKLFGLPIVRGAVVLVESLRIGIQALAFSAEAAVAVSNERPKSEARFGSLGLGMGFTIAISFLLGFLVFFYLPLKLTDLTGVRQGLLFNLIDGAFRLLFFMIYIVAVGYWGEMQRVFMYHGAEHKTIHNLEAGTQLSPENAQTFSRFHPRCGTSFLFLVMIVSIFVFALLGRPDTWQARLLRFALIPVIAGISFELIRFAGAHYDKKWVRWLSQPGLNLQRLTTREPSRDMLEVAIAALRAVL
ncbi:MAG TPA: DUF1385 domain-containing protein [Candidatus Dormibacteraeota bacterium]|nr:DUF1385 domain-containing protein [Candidatus Dormibacteraeota bacterium]